METNSNEATKYAETVAEFRSMLEAMTLSYLRDSCRELEIVGYSRMRKAELVDALMVDVKTDDYVKFLEAEASDPCGWYI